MTADDRQFVISGWSSSFRKSDHAGMISMATWADVMHREIGAVLDRADTIALVAEEVGELDERGRPFLYGSLVYRRDPVRIRLRQASPLDPRWLVLPYVFYAFTKIRYRERGVARRLFAAASINYRAPFAYACRTEVCGAFPTGRSKPLVARYEEPQHEPEAEQREPRRDPHTHDPYIRQGGRQPTAR